MLRPMVINQESLAALLKAANVEALSALSGVSAKTIYRLRHGEHSPNLRTVEALMRALSQLGSRTAS